MNISAYDVIYKEIVYKCVNIMPEWPERVIGSDMGVERPKFICVICIDSDGQVISIRDEAFMFRFIRKAGGSNG